MVRPTPENGRLTGAAAVLAAVIFGFGTALWAFNQPSEGASALQVLSFYQANSNSILIGGSLSLVSFLPFTVFAGGLRARLLARDRDEILAAVAFAGGVLLVAVGLGAESINMVGALRASDHRLTASLAQAVFEISYVLGYYAAGIAAAILLMAVAASRLRVRGLRPGPTQSLLVLVGVLFLTPLSRYLLAPAVLLLLVVGLQLLRPKRTSRRPTGSAAD